MFIAAATLSPLPGAKLERLRLSLNSPVVALENLAVGPAAAGIAVHSGQEALRLTLAVRSARSGQAIFFHPDGWGESELSDVAFDAALSFAEGMGFLFDDDLVEKGLDAAQAARAWADFLEDSLPEEEAFDQQQEHESRDTGASPAEVAAPPAFEDAGQADLEAAGQADLANAAQAPEGYIGPLATPAAILEAPAPPPLLSKFRFAASIPADRLLSPPSPPPEKPAPTNFVTRLLSRF